MTTTSAHIMSIPQTIPAEGVFLPDDLLTQIRESFLHIDACPFTGKRVFFENAGGSLTLESVAEQSAKVAGIPDNEHRDNPASRAVSQIVSTGRNDLANFMGANSGVIFGGETGTECLFRVIRAAALSAKEGGSIVASSVEHPATYDATAQWARRTNREWIEVPFDVETGQVTAAHYANCVRPDTRIATILHSSPVTGMSMDIVEIVRTIRTVAPECIIVVDGIQHAPHGTLAVDDYDVDAYVISPYKAYCRFNNGYAWISDRLSMVKHDRLLGKPADAWELGSRDPSAMAGVSAMVDYLTWLGGHFTEETSRRDCLVAASRAMQAHERALVHRLLHSGAGLPGLCSYPGLHLIGSAESPNREGVVSFAVEGYEAKQVVAELGARGIRVHARSDDVFSGNILRPMGLKAVTRISLAHYNSAAEIDLCLEALAEILTQG
ncbi:aminotransferase class V-fold PLP-dependent enzyme [Aidingimonas halophila]|uniref:Selenocysteine lyase/Cysteine desulfurase n=1 Tax=Aidingimonas halophila TaxID=574349 RepID=A0A1H2X6Y5_9GAMM|nr:aminotransferase class V-fold PLP-dependent enzyme [Aidingimonas halophila]GHC28209.1 cysteine desulfurase-like protein [Aidingimonas halophila]SDW88538.1 Selenocysteine lyase/Cysteine desulfurase [Aidingimonas halophila]